MENKIDLLLIEKKKLEDKLKRLLEEFTSSDNDNEDTWGGHDGPQSLRMENEKYLLDVAIDEIKRELKSLGYKDKIG
jgi:hypothetical protein